MTATAPADAQPSPENALAATRAARAAVREKEATAVAGVKRAARIVAQDQGEVDAVAAAKVAFAARAAARLFEWDAAGRKGARPVAAADVAAIQRAISSEANLAASCAMLETRQAELAAVRKELAATEAAVSKAAREALHADVRADFAEFLAVAAELRGIRERLCAWYLGVGSAALRPQEWLKLDAEIGAPLEQMGIASLWLNIPLNQLDPVGELDRPREARARIDSLIAPLEARLAELARGDAPPAAAEPSEAADAA